MGTSSWLATLLDWEMLEVRRGVSIEPSTAPVDMLPKKTGHQVANELGGRYLLRYLLPNQLGRFTRGSSERHFVTPTPYAPDETVAYLALPRPLEPRPFVLVLDPARIEFIWGPQWVRGAPGIQYILLNGFPQDAIVGPGAPWELEVR
jgi:hypothetical protein